MFPGNSRRSRDEGKLVNRKKKPRVCLAYVPPFNFEKRRRPKAMLLFRGYPASIDDLLTRASLHAAKKYTPGIFLFGMETDPWIDDTDIDKGIPWKGKQESGNLEEFLREFLEKQPFFTTMSNVA